MGTSDSRSASRRGFLKTVLLGTAAAATGTSFARADRQGGMRRSDQVWPYDLFGIRPSSHVVGGVLVEMEEDDYLVFDTVQHNEVGQVHKAGKAVIRLDGCLDWQFRTPGDMAFADHPVDPSTLDRSDTFMVYNSTWVEKLIAANPHSPLTKPGAPELHHCIFTFSENSFECVAARLNALVFQKSFAEVYRMLESL